MIVYRRPRIAGDKVRRRYSLLEDDNSVILTFTTEKGEDTIELDKQEWANRCVYVMYGVFNHKPDIVLLDILHSSPITRLMYSEQNGYTHIAKLVFDTQVHCVLHKSSDPIEGFENIEIAADKFGDDYLAENSDLFRRLRTQFLAKHKILKDCDIFSSISYLECQVDLLTRIVLGSSLKDHPLAPKLAQFDKCSVIDIKSNLAMDTELKYKKAVREHQSQYYRVK